MNEEKISIDYITDKDAGQIVIRYKPIIRDIGEFTRENVKRWFALNESPVSVEVDLPGIVDFHAIKGDEEIPWAKEESKAKWELVYA